MPTWSDFEAAAPELARAVRDRLTAHKHLTLATLRRDGRPRISGTEIAWEDGDLLIGSMLHAWKARDLQADPRYALHSGSDDPPAWTGDAKVGGVAEELANGMGPPGEGPYHRFRLHVTEASRVELAPSGEAIVVTWWTPEGGVQRRERA